MKLDPKTILRLVGTVCLTLVPALPDGWWRAVMAALGTGMVGLSTTGPGQVSKTDTPALQQAIAQTLPAGTAVTVRSVAPPPPLP